MSRGMLDYVRAAFEPVHRDLTPPPPLPWS